MSNDPDTETTYTTTHDNDRETSRHVSDTSDVSASSGGLSPTQLQIGVKKEEENNHSHQSALASLTDAFNYDVKSNETKDAELPLVASLGSVNMEKDSPPQMDVLRQPLEDASTAPFECNSLTFLNASDFPPMEPLPGDTINDTMFSLGGNVASPMLGGMEISFPPLADDSHGYSSIPLTMDDLPMNPNIFSEVSFPSPHPTERMLSSCSNPIITTTATTTVESIQNMIPQNPPSTDIVEAKSVETCESTAGRKRSVGKSFEKLIESKKKQKSRPVRSLPLNKRNHEAILAKQKTEPNNVSPASSSSNKSSAGSRNESSHVGKLSIEHYVPSEKIMSSMSMEGHLLRNTARQTCKCSKSKCLKLYCDCFQAGQVCTASCNCKQCLNTVKNSGPDGLRTVAIESILKRRSDAFDYRPKKIGLGCSCKKNRCLKKYCDCFSSGLSCKSSCKCVGCKNGKESDNANNDNNDVTIIQVVEIQRVNEDVTRMDYDSNRSLPSYHEEVGNGTMLISDSHEKNSTLPVEV